MQPYPRRLEIEALRQLSVRTTAPTSIHRARILAQLFIMSKLNEKQKRFVDEYLIDLNANQAAIRAGYSVKTARSIASELLTKPNIQEEIQRRVDDRAKRTEITQDSVLQLWWQQANVDINELVEYRRHNCRYCWGIDHQYQWTQEEYTRAVQQAEAAEKEAPNPIGGFGFEHHKEPNPKCPECGGDGFGELHIKDSRNLKGAARRIYNGVQVSKEGLRLLTLDRDKALENVARHLGMFPNKTELTGKDGKDLFPSNPRELTDEELANIASCGGAGTPDKA